MSQEGSPNGPSSFSSDAKGVRWGWIISALAVVVIVVGIWVNQKQDASQYYMTVSEFQENPGKYEGKRLRLAGKVKPGSIESSNNLHRFVVEDLGREIPVTYQGLVPDTFKEGVEVVVEGRGGRIPFEAQSLMAKCASKYQAGGLPPLEALRSQSRK
jgi:cytochrome c-type biogenesis protein CcmE